MALLVRGVVFALLWTAFVGQITLPEVVAAVVVGAASVAVLQLVVAKAQLQFAVDFADLVRIGLRLPGRTIVAAARVLAATPGRNRGFFRTIPFDPGEDDPRSVGRRALVTAAASLPPTAYVVWTDRENHRLIVRQLMPLRVPPGAGNREWPI